MISRHLALSFLVMFSVLNAVSQEDKENQFKYILPSNSVSDDVYLQLDGIGVLGSNSINSRMFSDLLFSSGFNDKAKSTYLENSADKVRVQARGLSVLTLGLGDKWVNTIYANYNQQAFYSSSSDFGKLALFGNKPYENQLVESNGLNAWNSTSYSVGVGKTVWLNNTSKLQVNAGVNLVRDIAFIRADNIGFFTAPNGESLDINLKQFEGKLNSIGFDGFGLDLGFILFKETSKIRWKLEVDNVSPFVYNQGEVFGIDTAFNFDGFTFDIGSLDSNGFSSYINDRYDDIYSRNTSELTVGLLPWDLSLEATYLLSEKSSIGVNLSTVSLGTYGWNSDLVYQNQLNNSWGIKSTVGYGNYSGLYFSQGVEAAINKTNIYAELIGLSGVAAPLNTSLIGMQLGLYRQY